jgi:serine/threonine protein kinase
MPFSPGTRLAHYEIQSLRGAGGMGEVYRALDVRLDRSVALKVLPAAVASDPEFQQRFEREARAIAALSHPSICGLFDIGEAPNPQSPEAEPVRYLVMEYLEGETLEETLRKRTLPIEHALRIAIQVADALDKAHRKGIVHRDLKPGNIMLAPGTLQPKLLDFGLAKVRPAAVTGMTAATMTSPLTERGTILGTLQYMAPEQVEGHDADHRTDIFSFGAVVYEMATGKRAFQGSTPASVMAAILEREPPPMATLQPLLPSHLDHVVRRCLAKNPDERWQSAGDVMRELEWVARSSAEPRAAPSRSTPRYERYAWIAGVVVLAGISAAALLTRRPVAPAPERRLEITTPATVDLFSFSVSPDGAKVVALALRDGRPQLWLRHLSSASTQWLKDTDGAQYPFWSPDSKSVGFGASGQLKRIDLESGTISRLADAPLFLGGTWNTDGSIIFAANSNSPLLRVSDRGGTPVVLTAVEPEGAHSFPNALPDGRHFLFFASGSKGGVYVGQIDGTPASHLLDADAAAAYSGGHLLFVRMGNLLAQRFDPERQTLSGEAVSVVDQVVRSGMAGSPVVAVSASAAGPILYRTGAAIAPYRFQVTRVNQAGTEPDIIANETVALNPSLSPDGRHLAFFKNSQIWLMDLQSRNQHPLTNDTNLNFAGVWSPDGKQIAYCSQRKGIFDLYLRDATGAGSEQLLLTTTETKMPTDWSKNGYLLYRSLSEKDSFDIWAMSMADRKAFPLIQTSAEERDGQFSPDGKWVAYQSNRTGRFEIWVAPFPVPGTDVKAGDPFRFTFDGGVHVRWGLEGKELFYIAPDGHLMSVPVTVQPGGGAVSPGTPRPAFQTGTTIRGTAGPSFIVLRDGFLTTYPSVPSTTSPITVLLDWRVPK